MARQSKVRFAEIERIIGLDSYTAHIDEVLGRGYAPEHAVRQSLALYEQLIDLVLPHANEWIATLVIPLHFADGERWSNEMDLRAPLVDEWQSEWASEEPPTIGIYRRNLLMRVERVEEYRCAITEGVLTTRRSPIHCYYRVWDSISGDGNPREYSRAIYLECHPVPTS
jgi:hypothetical protein